MKIGVLMSGGVDSSVAAWLLLQQGHAVEGITMINWSEEISRSAQNAADALKIPLRLIDLRQEFSALVIENFCSTYKQGQTPNPCVVCNEKVKFGLLLQRALGLGFEQIATGHYARILAKKIPELHTGLDLSKDQSYFLYRLNQEQLEHLVFPLGELDKAEVRKIAAEAKLPAAQIKDSQEICFITKDYQSFIAGRVTSAPGKFIDLAGNKLGNHRGLPFYTVGQRKGLGISAQQPLYVLALNPQRNEITLGENQSLFSNTLQISQVHWIDQPTADGSAVEAKIRYAAPRTPAKVSSSPDGSWQVTFNEPQRAITPGQSVVFYHDSQVLGGGIIQAAD